MILRTVQRRTHLLESPNDIALPFSNMRTQIQSSTDKRVFRCRQSNIRRLLPGFDYCRALFRCLNCAERFDHRALSSSRKLGGAAEHLIDSSEKRICRLSFEL